MSKRKPQAPGARFVSAHAAAVELGIPYTSLRECALRGELAVMRVGVAWYFDRRELEVWIEEHTERFGKIAATSDQRE